MKKRIIKNIILLFIAFNTIFLFSESTSPFYNNYVYEDSSIFIVMGKAIKNGMIMYKDIFDHKGPILFWIEALGQCIYNGRIGIFIIQVVSLFATLKLLYNTLDFFVKGKKINFIILIIDILFISFLGKGNYSEELSLSFISLCVYLVIKWLKNNELNDNKKIYIYSIIYGICFGIISLIRINNTATICGLLVGIIIILIKNKKIKELFISAFLFLLGLIMVYLPNVLYFLKNNALDEMIYGTFIHNILYLKENFSNEIFLWLKIIFETMFVSIIVFFILKSNENNNTKIVLFFGALVTWIVLFFGNGYVHYYLIAIPILSLIIIPFLEKTWNKDDIIIKLCIVIFVLLLFSFIEIVEIAYNKINVNNISKTEIEDFINKNIKDEDKDKILVYNFNEGIIYYYGKILPCNKYAFVQSYLFRSNPKLLEIFKQNMEDGKIKYIISGEYSDKKDIYKELEENYKIVDTMEIKIITDLEIISTPVNLYEYIY